VWRKPPYIRWSGPPVCYQNHRRPFRSSISPLFVLTLIPSMREWRLNEVRRSRYRVLGLYLIMPCSNDASPGDLFIGRTKPSGMPHNDFWRRSTSLMPFGQLQDAIPLLMSLVRRYPPHVGYLTTIHPLLLAVSVGPSTLSQSN
jgi:hypothetical protein